MATDMRANPSRTGSHKRATTLRLNLDAVFSIKVRLCHVRDDQPGIVREVFKSGFRYRTSDGRIVRDRMVLDRIQVLAIPPAWQTVWICLHTAGHLQATGRDARGRKQYRYHPGWISRRGIEKYSRLAGFGKALPSLRSQIEKDLAKPGLGRDKVLAALVKLLDQTHLRVGNEKYLKANKSFGLSTLRDQHVSFPDGKLHVRFRGKSGIWHERTVGDRVLARVVRRCRDLPGQELFQYVDRDGRQRSVESTDVNNYIRRASGQSFTAKDFRTWAGTVQATALLAELPAPTSKTAAERTIAGVVRRVAAVLGNTPAVCRKSYIHPGVISAYLAGTLPTPRHRKGLSGDESRLMMLFDQHKKNNH